MKRRVRILWISRHPPLPKQLEELRRVFGEFELIQYAGFVKDAKHVVELMRMYRADEVVTIIPLTMIYHLVNEEKVYPIFPKMESLPNDSADYDYVDPGSGRKYRFAKFVRIRGFEIDEEDLEPAGSQMKR